MAHRHMDRRRTMTHRTTGTRLRGLAILLLAVTAVGPARGGSAFAAADDRVCPITIDSIALDQPTPVDLLLPTGYARTNRRYPVLYLQHWALGTPDEFLDNTDLIALTQRLPLIVVMPDDAEIANLWAAPWIGRQHTWVPWLNRFSMRVPSSTHVPGSVTVIDPGAETG